MAGENLGQIGPYELRGVLGRGGMAVVYRAFQPSLAREVAIKVILPGFTSDPSFVVRFQREARAIAGLRHPNILTVYDFGQDPATGQYYIVTELLEGKTLRDLTGQPLPPERCAAIIRQIAGALEFAHESGLVHRDVKPTNILLDRRDRVVLSDFGIAKLMEDTSNLTASGAGIGTPSYMSPEQAMGDVVDGRSDQYSLGIVLYEMLTGRTPFRADTPIALVMAHATRPLPDPRQYNSSLSAGVVAVLQRALAKNPSDRFSTIGQFAQAFDQVVAGGATAPLQAAPPGSEFAATQPVAPSSFQPSITPAPAAPTGPGQPETGSARFATTPPPGSFAPPEPPGAAPSSYSSAYSFGNVPPGPTASAGYGGQYSAPPERSYQYGYNPVMAPARSRRGLLWPLLGLALVAVIVAATVTLTLLLTGPNRAASETGGSSSGPVPARPTAASGGSGAGAVGGSSPSGGVAVGAGTPAGPDSGTGAGGSSANCSPPLPAVTPQARMTPGGQPGLLEVEVLETACKPAKADIVGVQVFRQGDRDTRVADACCSYKVGFALPPGNYEVLVRYANGIEQFGSPVQVKTGQTTTQTINLQLGQAQFEVLEAAGKSARGSDVSLLVFREGDRNTRLTDTCCNNRLSVYLRPGRYEVVARYANGIEITAPPLEIKEGQVSAATLNFGVGQAQVELFESEGKSAKAEFVSLKVYRAGDRNTIITSNCCNNKLEFFLKPGSYEMVAAYANGIEQDLPPLEIKEGQRATRTVNFKVGQVNLDIVEESGASAKADQISVAVYKKGDLNTPIATNCCAARLSFILRPGLYEVQVKYSGGKIVTGPPLEIKEGQIASQTLKV